MLHTMMQACKETNMTYQALKFYCNQGLVPNVKRDKNNRRVFDDRDIAWISSLICLKKCGMSIQEMKEYLSLCLMGESTIPQRKEMLARKQEELRRSCPEELFTIIMRRFMMRISQAVAKRCGAKALVTGECLGQVASPSRQLPIP